MIQSIMLAAMGFIAASLMALLAAPAFWSRAVRLTSVRLRNALPLSEQEIRADKDLLRAEYALKVHQLERELDQVRLAAHRQQIEINRRDIEIRRYTDDLTRTEAGLNEHRNARTVLEQTVSERIPALERSLQDARVLLESRDTAINDLRSTSERQAAALEDGRAILTQRALEVQRLQALFQEAHAQARERRADGVGGSTGSSDTVLMLRAEMESLKARLAERGAVIDRLQSEVAMRPRSVAAMAGLQDGTDAPGLRGKIAEQGALIQQLNRDLEAASRGVPTQTNPPDELALTVERLQQMDTQFRGQTDEIARLRAENEAITRAGDPASNASVRESKIWLKARMDRVEGDLEREREQSGRLRAELAAANERMARQATQFRDDMRRAGNRQAASARDILVATGATMRPVAPAATSVKTAPAAPRASISARARELQRALQGHFGDGKPAAENGAGTPADNAPAAPLPDSAALAAQSSEAAVAAPDTASEATPRARLLQRLKTYEQA